MRPHDPAVSEEGRAHSGAPLDTGKQPLIGLKHASRSYGAVKALRKVSFDVRPGEVHGLCGHNGAGKSTLVKILVGLEPPDEGELRVRGELVQFHGTADAQRHRIGVVDQELSLVSQLTVAENMFLGNVDASFVTSRAVLNRRAAPLLERVGLTHVLPGRRVEELDVGERQLVEIARLLGRDAELLILDEPTATLTNAEIERVFETIRAVVSKGAGVVFVSHRLDEVMSLCDRVTVLRDGGKVGTRPVAALSKRELVDMMLGDEGRELSSGRSALPDGNGGVSVRGLQVGDRVSGFDLEAPRGTIVGLAGQVGSGASDILRALAGLEARAAGRVAIGDQPVPLASPRGAVRAGVHYLSNDRKGEGLFLEQSIESNLVATRLAQVSSFGVLRRRRMRREARALAELVDVDVQRLSAPVRVLSGGNQQKVFVGRCLKRPRLDLLLLDDPTRGVDVGGRAEIHRLVRLAADGGATVIFASSELDEILELSDLVVTLFAGRVVSRRARRDASAAQVFSEMTHRVETEEPA
jgi:ABC-type sugar transport system ATPase subunit